MKILRTVSLGLIATFASFILSIAPASAVTQTANLQVTVTANVTASINTNLAVFTWASVSDSTNQFLPADVPNLTVTGSLKTSKTGTATIAVSAPASIVGTSDPVNDILAINSLSITCSGAGNTGKNASPTYAGAHTALTASSSTTCATWGANSSVNMNFALAMFLDDRSLSADTYTSSASAFGVVATAT